MIRVLLILVLFILLYFFVIKYMYFRSTSNLWCVKHDHSRGRHCCLGIGLSAPYFRDWMHHMHCIYSFVLCYRHDSILEHWAVCDDSSEKNESSTTLTENGEKRNSERRPTTQSYYKIESDLFDIQFNNDWPICHSNDITQREIQLCSKWTSLSVRYSVIPSRHQLLYRICQSIKNNCLELFINVFACVFVLLVLFFTKFIDCLIPNWTTVTIEAILS